MTDELRENGPTPPSAESIPEIAPEEERPLAERVGAAPLPLPDDLSPELPPELPPERETTGAPAEERPTVRPLEFGPLESSERLGDDANIDLLLDVRLPIAVELGRTEVEVQEILGFGPGSVIPLEKAANEPVDLLVNGVLVARGEVVVVDDHFGVRLTSLISPEERIRTLGGAA